METYGNQLSTSEPEQEEDHHQNCDLYTYTIPSSEGELNLSDGNVRKSMQNLQRLLLDNSNQTISTLAVTTSISMALADLRTYFFPDLLMSLENHELEYFREMYKKMQQSEGNSLQQEADDLKKRRGIKSFAERTKWAQS